MCFQRTRPNNRSCGPSRKPPNSSFFFSHPLSYPPQATSARSSGPQRCRNSACIAAGRSRVRFRTVSASFDAINSCASNEHERTTAFVRPQPQNLLLPHPDFCLLPTLVCPFVRLSGDLSKVQWPAGLQSLNLGGCRKIEGKFLPRLTPFVLPTNTTEQPLVRPQPQTS